jgi:hypothetical protein
MCDFGDQLVVVGGRRRRKKGKKDNDTTKEKKKRKNEPFSSLGDWIFLRNVYTFLFSLLVCSFSFSSVASFFCKPFDTTHFISLKGLI